MKEKEDRYVRREWLNPKGSDDTGAMSAEMRFLTDGRLSGNVTIRDCSEQVCITFSCTKKKFKERIKKIDTMISILQGMREYMMKYEGKMRNHDDYF